jgi:hypothetical protein
MPSEASSELDRFARAWLLRELEADVVVPCQYVCDMLGLDADALAAAIRRRCG